MKKLTKSLFAFCLTVIISNSTEAQSVNAKPSFAVWDGMVVAGYVNNGAYLNFGGPGIKLTKKPWVIALSMLPSFRIKEDNVAAGAKKNSMITTALGSGITVSYKHIALQVPVYYNAKTATADGKWNVGVGAGFKF